MRLVAVIVAVSCAHCGADPQRVASLDPSPTDDSPDGGGPGDVDAAVPLDFSTGPHDLTARSLDIVLGPRPSPIADENAHPGSRGWQLQQPAGALLGAFTDATSYAPGDTIEVHAAAQSSTTATWTLWRLGYYGGTGGRQLAAGGPVPIPVAAAARMDAATGAVQAPWGPTFRVTLPPDAVTGFYVVRLASAVGECYAPLVVREPSPGAPLVWPIAFNTYQAYNAWGGTSLYDNARSDWKPSHAYAASFERPYAQGDGAGQFFSFDRWFLYFAEAQGWDIAYASDLDLDGDANLLAGRRGVVVMGHSEYWTGAMRASVDAAVAHGVSLASLGANHAYWQVRVSASPWSGRPRRLLVGYKDFAALDPVAQVDPSQTTTRFRDPPLNHPENALLGSMFGSWQTQPAPLVVSDGSHWLWTGAGVQTGDTFANLMWGESDKRFANGAEPSGLVTVGTALVPNHDGLDESVASTIYTAPSGALVFAAATWGWGPALAQPGAWDERIQVATANLFARMLGRPAPGQHAPLVLDGPGVTPPAWSGAAQVSTVTSLASLGAPPTAIAAMPGGCFAIAAGDAIYLASPGKSGWKLAPLAGGAPGDGDGAAASARFRNPRGLATTSDGTLYIADAGNSRIRALAGGKVSTVAGSTPGFADGVGTAAQLSTPMGLAALPDGSLVVADMWNMRIRSVRPDGLVSTWVGNGVPEVVDGPGAQAHTYFPVAIAARSDGRVFFVEAEDGLIRQISPDAAHTVSTFAGVIGLFGTTDGTLDVAAVGSTLALTARAQDVLLVDGGTWRVRRVAGGSVTSVAGTARALDSDGAGNMASLWSPSAITSAPDGSVWVADEGALRKLTGL